MEGFCIQRRIKLLDQENPEIHYCVYKFLHGIKLVLITGDFNIEAMLSFVLVENSNLLQEFLGAKVE